MTSISVVHAFSAAMPSTSAVSPFCSSEMIFGVVHWRGTAAEFALQIVVSAHRSLKARRRRRWFVVNPVLPNTDRCATSSSGCTQDAANGRASMVSRSAISVLLRRRDAACRSRQLWWQALRGGRAGCHSAGHGRDQRGNAPEDFVFESFEYGEDAE